VVLGKGPVDPPAPDPRLSELRLVEWEYEGGDEPRRELVPAAEVERLVAAVLALHHDPGLNPHNGEPAAPLRSLRVGRPALGQGYWWSAANLQDSGEKARLVTWRFVTRFERSEADPPDPV